MAYTHVATTIVCDAGPNTVAGPIQVCEIVCPGAVTVSKSGNTFLTLAAGVHSVEFRSASAIVVTGACTLLLELD